jgi:CheY-like chemotaxis protein
MNYKGKVLVIEDNPDWQDILKEYLEEAGFYVEVVAEKQKALKRLREEIFHFATVDLQLDEDTRDPTQYEGWDILEDIVRHRTDKRMPTMVITTYEKDYKKIKKEKKLQGASFMSKKKFDEKKFIESVEHAVSTLDIKFHGDKKT